MGGSALWIDALLLVLSLPSLLRAEIPVVPCPEGRWAEPCRACDDGSEPSACVELGRAYELGDRGLHRDASRAGQLYTIGCEGGDPAACARAADMTRGSERASYLSRACEGGIGEACTDLGDHFSPFTSAGGRDLPRALEGYEAGCHLDDGEACYHLALAFLNGDGRPLDRERGRELLALSCGSGYDVACNRLHPPQLDLERRLQVFADGGVAVDIGHDEGARFTFDLALDYRHRVYLFPQRRAALQLVAEAGYSYHHQLERGPSWLLFGLGLRWTHDQRRDRFAVTLMPAFVISTAASGEVGIRTTLRFGMFYDAFFVALSHEWQYFEGEDYHLFKATMCINILGMIIASEFAY